MSHGLPQACVVSSSTRTILLAPCKLAAHRATFGEIAGHRNRGGRSGWEKPDRQRNLEKERALALFVFGPETFT